MRKRLVLVFFALLLLASATGAQERVAVFQFESIGVDPETVAAATHIFRNDLNETGRFSVISKADMEAKLAAGGVTDFSCGSMTCATEYGSIIGTGKVSTGSLTVLGERVTIEVNLIDVAGAEVEFSDMFSVESVDDLSSALRKLAEALASRRKIVSQVDRYAITDEETTEPRRKSTYTTSGGGFGIGFPLGDTYSGVSNMKTVVWVLRHEAQSYVIENSFGISWGSGGEQDTLFSYNDQAHTIDDKIKIVSFPWDIGLRYTFKRESDFTPFVGGGIGLHFIVSQTAGTEEIEIIQNDAAFALHASCGIYAFQSYDIRMTLEGKYTALFTNAFAGDDEIHHQVGIILTMTARTSKLTKRSRGCGGLGGGGCF